ncbi:MAG: GRP family sugar transporter [Spirochaetia bacterium]|nr:GRP family sugar transporter [Spirochaetia bacterium]
MDIFISLIPALCWGYNGLVSGIMGGSAKEQTIGMTWGAFLFL